MENEYEIPMPEGSFDIVLSGQVIEHVRMPWRCWLGSARPGGRVITANPASWPVHQAPVDCWRIYLDGMRALSEEARLACELSTCESLEARPRA
jgi:2-polyprenyl-3-methyl-5-hydroxy-6-metoxy-1,4-benzoquinol methylase